METWDVPPPSGIKLADSVDEINKKVNYDLSALLGSLGRRAVSPQLEKAVYERLGEPKGAERHLAPIEKWSNALPEAAYSSEGKIYKPNLADTIYKDDTVSQLGGLAPVMLVNDIYIGSDKLGHFFQLGYNEYYARTIGKDAVYRDKAIQEGNKTEAGQYGLLFTGVYSNADIAANKAGLKFYEELGKSPNLNFDIRRYIAKDWNEQTNRNYYGGHLSDLPRKQIDGNWSGMIFWSDGTSARCDVTLKTSLSLSLGWGNADVEGTYTYIHPKASHTTGHLKGVAKPIRNPDADNAIESVRLDLDWKEGAAVGKATFNAVGFANLDGSWTRGTNGGKWTLQKT